MLLYEKNSSLNLNLIAAAAPDIFSGLQRKAGLQPPKDGKLLISRKSFMPLQPIDLLQMKMATNFVR